MGQLQPASGRLLPAWLLYASCLVALAGCNSMQFQPAAAEKASRDPPPVAPGKESLRVGQFIFLADFELKKDHPIFKDLAGLPTQVGKELHLLASDQPVQVYLFEDRERYRRYMKALDPKLPERRAFFAARPNYVGGPDDLFVYTYWGDRVHQDLRHELTHALVHTVIKDVPLWLDEGLAEYFEVPVEWQGTNRLHLEQIRKGPFQPHLARLEQLNQLHQMTPAEYRESWGWVHLMLKGPPSARAVLLDYLQQLRTHPAPGALAPRLAAVFPDPEKALTQHLMKVEVRPPATAQK